MHEALSSMSATIVRYNTKSCRMFNCWRIIAMNVAHVTIIFQRDTELALE